MKTRENVGGAPFLPATAGRLNVGGLPLGSAASRAAARMLLKQRESEQNDGLRFQFVNIVTGQPIDFEARATATEKDDGGR